MNKRLSIIYLCILFLLLTSLAGAEMLKDLENHFLPRDGSVIAVDSQDVYVLFQDSQALVPGDLLSVVVQSPLVDPVSQQLVGHIADNKAIMRVTSIKDKLCVATVIESRDAVVVGDSAQSYANLAAVFVDRSGDGEAVYENVKNRLPWMSWGGYLAGSSLEAAQLKQSALLFVHEDNRLDVRDAEQQLIRTYQQVQKVQLAPQVVASQPAPVPPASGFASRLPSSTSQSYGVQAGFGEGFQHKGDFRGSISYAKFVRFNGRQLIATTDGVRITLYENDGALQRLGTTRLSEVEKVASVCWWSAEGDDLYLVVNGWKEKRFVSTLFKVDGKTTHKVQSHIPFLFGSYDEDGNGVPELLLGQQYAYRSFVSRKVVEATLDGERLSFNKFRRPLPRYFSVQGSVFADVTGDGASETIVVRNRSLYVYQGTEELFSSANNVGGTLSSVMYETNPSNPAQSMMATEMIHNAPLVSDVNGDGVKDLLMVVTNKNGGLLSLGESVRSTIGCLTYTSDIFTLTELINDTEFFIPAFDYNGQWFTAVFSQKSSLWDKKKDSMLFIIGE